jgi:putative acetyltransferase
MLEIREIDGEDPEEIEVVRTLIREYGAELGEDLYFQGFEEELESLPGKYAPPKGVLLLGTVGGRPVGCVALRPLEEEVCEMKRLYVRPAYRGHAYGRELAEEILSYGKELGYKSMKLDTLAKLVPAIMLYRDMGFVDCEPYYDNPIPGVVYLAKKLSRQ